MMQIFVYCLNSNNVHFNTVPTSLTYCRFHRFENIFSHYTDVIMDTIASRITSLTVVYSTVYSDVIKDNIKAPRHWPLSGEFTGDR